MSILIQKQHLRNDLKIKRKNYMQSSYENRFKCENTFLNSEIYKNASVILTYESFGNEADTSILIKRAISDGKSVYTPQVIDEFNMRFVSKNDKNNIYSDDRAVCIVPGLGFDAFGGRLGYGRGYYDRFLAAHPMLLKVGFCPDCSFVQSVPTDKYDINMQFIIKNKSIITI